MTLDRRTWLQSIKHDGTCFVRVHCMGKRPGESSKSYTVARVDRASPVAVRAAGYWFSREDGCGQSRLILPVDAATDAPEIRRLRIAGRLSRVEWEWLPAETLVAVLEALQKGKVRT